MNGASTCIPSDFRKKPTQSHATFDPTCSQITKVSVNVVFILHGSIGSSDVGVVGTIRGPCLVGKIGKKGCFSVNCRSGK